MHITLIQTEHVQTAACLISIVTVFTAIQKIQTDYMQKNICTLHAAKPVIRG